MSDKYCHDIDKCCPNMNCTENKKNCSTECCSGLPEEINPNLAMAKSFPILAERIFDCMILENPQFTITPKPIKFIVTSTPTTGSYANNDPVCIDEICVNYDLIAPVYASNVLTGTTTVCSKQVSPTPVPGSSVSLSTVTVSNHYRFELSRNTCCYKHGIPQDGSKCRLVEQGLIFYVSNLKVFVSGKIGCLPFSANYTPASESLLSGCLGFPEKLNFFGKICIPTENKNVIIDEVFTPCLSIDCIDPATPYASADTSFTANIEASLVIRKDINVLIEEKLSVLAVPASEDQLCHGSSILCEPCHHKCRD